MKTVLSYYLLFLSIVRISPIYSSALHGYGFLSLKFLLWTTWSCTAYIYNVCIFPQKCHPRLAIYWRLADLRVQWKLIQWFDTRPFQFTSFCYVKLFVLYNLLKYEFGRRKDVTVSGVTVLTTVSWKGASRLVGTELKYIIIIIIIIITLFL